MLAGHFKLSFLMLSGLVYFSLQAMETQKDIGIRLSGHILRTISPQAADQINMFLFCQNDPQKVNKFFIEVVERATTVAQAVENTKSFINQNPQLVAKLISDKFGPYEIEKLLYFATIEDKSDLVSVCIKLGANIEMQEMGCQTPLISAARAKYICVVSELLQAGAKVNAQDVKGDTPLIALMQIGPSDLIINNSLKITEMLLLAGANPHLRCITYKKQTARDCAEERLRFLSENPTVLNDSEKLATVYKQIVEKLKEAERTYKAP